MNNDVRYGWYYTTIQSVYHIPLVGLLVDTDELQLTYYDIKLACNEKFSRTVQYAYMYAA